MTIKNELSSDEKRELETKLFSIFLESLRKREFGNGSEKIWKEALLIFFKDINRKYPHIFQKFEDLSKLTLTIKIEEVDKVIEEKKVSCSCSGWEFHFPIHVQGRCSKFRLFDSAIFLESVFFGNFESDIVEFFNTHFFGGLQMSHYTDCITRNIKFFGGAFGKTAIFIEQKFDSFVMLDPSFEGDVELDFLRTDFSKKVLLAGRRFFRDSRYGRCNLILRDAIFDCSFVCSLKLKECPDFSKSSFLRGKIIEETWQIDEDKIGKKQSYSLIDDESKFRFLKKYFAEQGNHFKEQQYFSYEMMAHEKLLRTKVFSFSEIKNNFCTWLKNLSEMVLFSAYKLISNFGMSWARPLFWLIVSSRFLALELDVIKTESLKSTLINFLNVFKWGDKLSYPTVSFFEALTKTLLPLSTAKDFLDPYDWSGNIHCLINGILIFLLIIGLRNKFKIK